MSSAATRPTTAFQRLWETDAIREKVLSQCGKPELCSLRLASRSLSKRTTPHAFRSIDISFGASTFTKPARLAALRRIGPWVRRVKFCVAYGFETMLPPLLEPSTGTEVEFVYTPDCDARRPELSHHRLLGQTDEGRALAELLIKQYPPLYHAAVNVPSFVAAFSCLPNLRCLAVACPSEDSVVPSAQSIVDYALISLRIAVERSPLPKLDTLSLSPVQPHVVKLLNPVFGPGARPDSPRRWRQIRNLTVDMPMTSGPTQLKQLHAYLHVLSPNLQSFVFRWMPPVLRPSARYSIARKPVRPTSTGTSYFPGEPAPETFHRGANPLTLHLSSFLQAGTPAQKPPAHSLPSMSSASTLRSASSNKSSGSSISAPPSASSSCRTTPSSSPVRQPRPAERPKLRCQPAYPPPSDAQRPSSSGSTSSASSVPGLSPSSSSSSPRSPPPPLGNGMRPLAFPKLSFFSLDSISCAAGEIAAFIDGHAGHLSEFRLEHTTLEPGGGDWDDALAPLRKLTGQDERWKDQRKQQQQQQHEAKRQRRNHLDRMQRKTSAEQQQQQQQQQQRPRTPPRAVDIPRPSAPPCGKARYEEVPIFLGPELSSPVDLSPVRIVGVDQPLPGTAGNSLAAEIGLDNMAHDMVAELPPEFDDYDVATAPPVFALPKMRSYSHDAGLEPRHSRLSLSFGLPGVEPSPMIGAGAGAAANRSRGEHEEHENSRRGRTGSDNVMGERARMVRDALMPTPAQTRAQGQKELEDGVRKLLAQTVFPWF